ncbi:MAG: HAMP domain-containing histidine kinase [Ruminococcus sp.]|uniref:sensor histidine kinase n=1 Tax=Ruminococcus sp. TaxID=41978 RepID=UPI0025D7A3E5|nr:HAMP domain-containing sensor histidine kinase [Ruminococcus sp.]MBO4867115.1 HAMP domain-containing histidine kinase [Ruminococcus sp.]
MIKRLRRKFVLIAAASVLAVELIVVGLINVINIGEMHKRQTQLMNILCENDGDFPEFGMWREQMYNNGSVPGGGRFFPPDMNGENKRFPDLGFKLNEETRYQTRYFYVRYNRELEPVEINTGHVAAVTSAEALSYAEEVSLSGKTSGFQGNYRFEVRDTIGGKLFVFLDCREDIRTQRLFLLISAAISIGGWLLVCLLIIVCSRFAVRPFIENYEKQKMFITDAGHEIKTPLAIIQANTEVIEMLSEPSEWTVSIKNQIERLNGLIADLLRLSRMDEESVKLVFAEFDLSNAFADIAGPFRTLAENKGLSLAISTQEGIRMNGDESSIRQLVSILTENAVKYCDAGGSIEASVEKTSSGRHAVIRVKNDCAEPPSQPERLFDRFYRADKSRKREDGETKSGYGIGLSVAKAVTESHKGKISCKTEDGKIVFTVKLRCL